MKDMSNIYRFKSTDELKTLRSKKLVALEKLRAEWGGYFTKQEIQRQSHLLKQIDAELASRRDQPVLL